jgi:C4-dicarboxylate-binding protein DctP
LFQLSRRNLLKLGAAAGTTTLLSAPFVIAQSAPITIRLSHVVAASGHPKGDAAALFAERVNSQLEGQVKVEVFPSSQLYNDDQVLEAMILGNVEMAAPSLSKLEQFTLQFRVFDLPFLFSGIDAVDRFQQGESGRGLLQSLDAYGLQGLGYWHIGMKQFSANRPLLMPEDAAGLLFRIQSSDVLQAMIEQLGASAQKMAFAEVYGALQTGVVDGQENTWSNIYTKRFFEVQDGASETNHGILDYIVIASADFMASLPDDIRDELMRIFHEVTEERNALSTAINLENRQKIIDEGGVVRELNDMQRNAWVEALRPVWDRFSDDIGADIIDAAFNA